MKRISRVSIGVFGLCLLLLPARPQALEVGLARIHDGEVRVTGKGAAKDAPISWQGALVTTSTKGGSFDFASSNIPATCVGKLSDGVTTLFIAVSGCTASGVTLPSSVAPVAATGQTTSYAFGDDGALQKGVPSPSPRFTDNLDGTITDNLTALIWLKDGNCLGEKPWLGALAAVDRLQDGVCGLSDGSVPGAWRLPNRNELLSLSYNGSGLPFPYDPFLPPDETSVFYWSSTSYQGILGWTVRIFEDSFVDRGDKASAQAVIAVRGGF